MPTIDATSPTALSASLDKLLKPGSRTSEFITLVAVWGASLATLLGAFNTSSPRFNAILKIAALVAAAASHVGYALSRGDVKSALGSVAEELIAAGAVVPVSPGKHAATNDAGAVDLVGLVAGVLVLVGLIWLVIGFTHHTLDVFGLVLLLIGLGVYLLFSGALGTRGTFRR